VAIKNNRDRLLILLLITLFIGACSGGGNDTNNEDGDAILEANEGPSLSSENIKEVLGQIPSPIEISLLLTESDTEYDPALPNDAVNVSKYNSSFQKAVNLGIYASDLGYTNIYRQHQDGINYVDAIRDLTNDLNIGHFFDFQVIKRLASNGNNLDSLLMITTQDFNDINNYLQEQNRSNTSVLLLSGGWIEAMHILCAVTEKTADRQELLEKIGEQKIILDDLVVLLDAFKGTSPQIADFHADMSKLSKAYENVSIQYTYEKSTSKVVDGMLVIEDESSSNVTITEEDFEQIKSAISTIRNQIVG